MLLKFVLKIKNAPGNFETRCASFLNNIKNRILKLKWELRVLAKKVSDPTQITRFLWGVQTAF